MSEVDTQEVIPASVKVSVDNGSLNVHQTVADFGGYQTYVLTGSENPFRILRSDPNRSKAYVMVTGTGPIWIGTESFCEQIKAGLSQTAGMVPGGYVATGMTVTVTHKQELWMVGDGTHSATVTVINERWA